MDKIYLTFREKRLLFFMRFVKKVKPHFDVSHLVDFGLIAQNYSGVTNQYGYRFYDDSYSLTDFELRFRIAKRQDRWRRIVTPIVVTILTDAVLNAARWLLQWIKSLP